MNNFNLIWMPAYAGMTRIVFKVKKLLCQRRLASRRKSQLSCQRRLASRRKSQLSCQRRLVSRRKSQLSCQRRLASRINKLFFLFLTLFITSTLYAKIPITIIPDYNTTQYDQQLDKYIQQLNKIKDPLQREIKASSFFLEKPYYLFPNGEGKTGKYDKAPLYRTDKFDCLTYVSMIIALTQSQDLESFKQHEKDLDYKNGQVSFITRNHFTSTDYDINNQRAGFIKDITDSIVDDKGKIIAKTAITDIDKPTWVKNLPASRINLFKYPGNKKAKALLDSLHALSTQVSKETANVRYIPMTQLFNSSGEANLRLFKQIPPGTIIEIVRTDWQGVQDLGTDIDISHLGIVVPSMQGAQFREASSVYNKVTDVPLIGYLRGYLPDPTVIGINLQQINLETLFPCVSKDNGKLDISPKIS